MNTPDFSGWATRYNIKCADQKTIKSGAFDNCDGKKVPLVWNHQHNEANNILGHAILSKRREGIYADCYLNNTESGRVAKACVEHGDLTALSIFANHLTQKGKEICHGIVREVSICIAGANPEAFIDNVMAHSEEEGEAAVIYNTDPVELIHADDEEDKTEDGETVQDVFNTLSEKQKTVVYALIGQALEQKGVSHSDDDDDIIEHSYNDEGGNESMKRNIFEDQQEGAVLSHSDCEQIITMAKSSAYGTLQHAIEAFIGDNKDTLAHDDLGIENISTLFPEYKDVRGGAPEMITSDQGWIGKVLAKVHKSPISRIRTRQADVKSTRSGLRAQGYTKGTQKAERGNIRLLHRTTDPQTVYVKSKLDRDDIVDIVDFDVVQYMYNIDRMNLNEELATAIMIGDGREVGDDGKISEDHIRPIFNDDELYAIHAEVNIDAARTALQGTNTNLHFGDNYIYAEAIIQALLYAREHYKGTGTPDFWCEPHLVNVMLLARDRNGRRIYDKVSDLAAALNVNEIITCEQFANVTRTTSTNQTKKLLGIMTNLSDYSLGATKGGEITHFTDFDIDFNQEKSLLETRCSGALTRIKSAIVLEEDATVSTGGSDLIPDEPNPDDPNPDDPT